MIGQTVLRTHIEKLLLVDQLPRFSLIVGSKGAGKRTLAHWIAAECKYSYEVVDDLKIDSIRSVIESSLTLRSRKIFILSDAQEMNIQAQNALLKSLEEPSNNAYYIMTVTALSAILGTIRSRAQMFSMSGYTRDELREFTEEEEILNMCSTPGQIKKYLSMDWEGLLIHCEKVIDNVGRISLANVFNILKAVDEANYDLIIPTMQHVVAKKVKDGYAMLRQLKILSEASADLENVTGINVRNALESTFIRLWEVS